MSREHHKNLSRGIKSSLVGREQRVRASRHGEPHSRRVRRVAEQKDGSFKVLFENKPVTEPYKMLVASEPTGTYGQKNTGGDNAGQKSVKVNKK